MSIEQIELLINIMENHKDLVRGRLRLKEARTKSKKLWEECATLLNITVGAYTSVVEWNKVRK